MRKTRFKENVRRKGYGEAHRRICALYACIRRHINRTMFGGNGYLCVQRLNGSNNSITELFEWDPTEKVATRPMFMQYRVPGQTYALFYTHDGNKNVSEVVHFSRANGVAAHYEYAPFGEVTAQVRQGGIAAYDFAALNPWRFSSEYADDASATVYYNYRHYEPVMGRWLSRDPIFEKGGKNLYAACHNDMFSRVDCLGRNPVALVALDALIAGALSAMSFVAMEISQNSIGSESLAEVLNRVVSGLETCLETVRQLAEEARGSISEVVDELEKLRRQACEELNNVVQQTKKDIGSFHPAKCDCDMNCYELMRRKNAWHAEGVARAQRDVLCWDCGDVGHQSQQADVWKNFGRCFLLWTIKCSWR